MQAEISNADVKQACQMSKEGSSAALFQYLGPFFVVTFGMPLIWLTDINSDLSKVTYCALSLRGVVNSSTGPF